MAGNAYGYLTGSQLTINVSFKHQQQQKDFQIYSLFC